MVKIYPAKGDFYCTEPFQFGSSRKHIGFHRHVMERFAERYDNELLRNDPQAIGDRLHYWFTDPAINPMAEYLNPGDSGALYIDYDDAYVFFKMNDGRFDNEIKVWTVLPHFSKGRWVEENDKCFVLHEGQLRFGKDPDYFVVKDAHKPKP